MAFAQGFRSAAVVYCQQHSTSQAWADLVGDPANYLVQWTNWFNHLEPKVGKGFWPPLLMRVLPGEERWRRQRGTELRPTPLLRICVIFPCWV